MNPKFKKQTKRNARRRRINKGRKAPKIFKSSQLRNTNAVYKPQVQVFTKTLLSETNPSTLIYAGTNSAISLIGGISLVAMPDLTNIIALYNRYKILSCTYTWNLQANSPTQNLGQYDLPRISIRYNYDTALASSSIISRMQELPNVKQFQFTPEKTQVSYTWYPRCNEPVYLSGVLTGYKLAKQQYIDVGYTGVPHYGIMWYADRLSTGLSLALDITYKVAFKYVN